MNRLALYVFYEKNGEVLDHVIFYLNALKKICQDVVCLVNGKISPKGILDLHNRGIEIVKRQNQGFDFGAWQYAFNDYLGERLSGYDEVILCNCSCYGPLYPFEELFKKMDEKNCDFWGLYKHPAIEGRFPAHLQSYFLVLRSPLIRSSEFKEYWEKLPVAKTWNEAVAHETSFTQYFEDRGFVSESFIPTEEYATRYPNPPGVLGLELVKKFNFPLIKRKLFSEKYYCIYLNSRGTECKRLVDYLNRNPIYDNKFIFQDLNKTCTASHIRNRLHNNFIVNHKCASGKKNTLFTVLSFNSEKIEELFSYVKKLPKFGNVIVYTNDNTCATWKKKSKKINIDVVHIDHDNKEIVYWIDAKNMFEYKYACFINDCNIINSRIGLKNESYINHAWENIMYSEDYIAGVEKIFEENPHIGLLMPPPPIFSDLRNGIINFGWGDRRPLAEKLYRRMNLTVPFDEKPEIPFFGMFWCRTQAFKPLFRYDWKQEDFTSPIDNFNSPTVRYVLQCMYSMICQEEGFMSGWIMTEETASLLHDNLMYKLKYHV